MSRSPGDGPTPWWDPLGFWARSGFGDIDLPGGNLPGLPAQWNLPQTLLDLLRSRLVGRAVSFGEGRDAVAFTLTSLEASVDQVAAVSGQVDDVQLGAEGVTWRGVRFERVIVRLRNYHTRVRARPVVVAAPVDVTAVLSSETLDAVLARVAPSWSCEVTTGGEVRLRWSRRPTWGHLQVQVGVADGVLVLRPRAVGRGHRARRVARWIPSVRRPLSLPERVRLTGLEGGAGEVVVHLRVDEWSLDLSRLVSWARTR